MRNTPLIYECYLRDVDRKEGRWVGRLVGRSCFGQVMSPCPSDQMSQRSQVSRIAAEGVL